MSIQPQQPSQLSAEGESCSFIAPPPFTVSSEYRGQCKNGLADGQGVVTGQLRDPKKGVLTFRIEGNFREGRKDGYSTYKRSDGFSSAGEFREGKSNGTFVITEESGNKYARTFRDGVPIGGQQPVR
jgi:hypothetical protein